MQPVFGLKTQILSSNTKKLNAKVVPVNTIKVYLHSFQTPALGAGAGHFSRGEGTRGAHWIGG